MMPELQIHAHRRQSAWYHTWRWIIIAA